MSKRIVWAAAVGLALVIAGAGYAGTKGAAPEAPPEPAKIRTLLITGDDVGAHKWKDMSVATREVLEASGKFDIRVEEGWATLGDKDALQKYDLVVFMLYNKKKAPFAETCQANLFDFVKGGKGFVVCHLASASFPECAEWGKLCGRYWVMRKSGHGPRKPFTAKVTDAKDPITEGIKKEFTVDDELYAKLLGDSEIKVLIEAYSDWSKKVEPLMFTKPYGKGRVFHNAFGHDAKPIKNPNVAKLMVRGCEWAATGKVAD